MTTSPAAPPQLEERFTMPPGWRWHTFCNAGGKPIRFGTAAPESGVPDAVVIGLQGMGEFTEKYFELARDLISRNLSFWMIDWQGQGKSHRHLKDPHKRHSTGFEEDVADLHYFILEYVKHSAVHPDVGRIPLVMLGHSTGANIGLQFLRQYPEIFACAAFTAPLIGIKALGRLPPWLCLPLAGLCREVMDRAYTGFGEKRWRAAMRDDPRNDIHSTDPVRKKVHNIWCQHDEALQVGNVTYGWIYHACRACLKLQRPGFLDDLPVPCLFALAGRDALVDNIAARKVIGRMKRATLLELPEARHEILMERDEWRGQFLAAFGELLRASNLKEKLKPF